MIKIGRHIEGISLNPLEYLLDGPEGDIVLFKSEEDAKSFLKQEGITNEDDLNDCFVYVDSETKEVN